MNMLPNGIEHGPYPNIPEDILEVYLQDPERFGGQIDMTLEQFIADRESEWQCVMHSEAVDRAAVEGRISAVVEHHYLRNVLRPWWIGSRRPGEYESQF